MERSNWHFQFYKSFAHLTMYKIQFVADLKYDHQFYQPQLQSLYEMDIQFIATAQINISANMFKISQKMQ